jgi:ATP-dependent RNA helicase RhlE
VMVATDIAARGLDVEHISHVINFDMPATADDYIHRIGRTGRAEHSGDAFTLVTPDDKDMIRALERIMGKPLPRETLEGFNYDAPMPEPYTPTARAAPGRDARTPFTPRTPRRPARQPNSNRGLRQKYASPAKK